MVLYHKTSASGHTSRPQNNESTNTVNVIKIAAVGKHILIKLKIQCRIYNKVYIHAMITIIHIYITKYLKILTLP